MPLICPISHENIKSPIEITICGHYFEKVNLFEHIIRNGHRCPMCRVEFETGHLYISRALSEMLAPQDKSIQTDPDELPTLALQGDDILLPERPFRVVNLDEQLFNPQSMLNVDVELRTLNSRFNGIIPIYQYIYQSLNCDANDVALMLARTGYLIYDCFTTGRFNNLYRYVIYSSCKMADGSNNNLSKFKKLRVSNRLS